MATQDTPKRPRRENAVNRLKANQRALLESSSSTEDEIMSASEAMKLRKENQELKKENKLLRHLNLRLQKIVTAKPFLLNSSDLEPKHTTKCMDTLQQPAADSIKKQDTEKLASDVEQDNSGVGDGSFEAAAAGTPARVLFKENCGRVYISKDVWLIDTDFNFLMGSRNDSVFVRDAATKIFSTAGLVGRSVTGRPSNRTKGDPKPPLDSVKLSALKDYAGCEVPELHQDFTAAKIRQVLFSLNSKSAPGPDGVPNKRLKNLDNESIHFLTE
ncbi:hypothetical protein HPB49_005998 [Dermacentor silvarum]|uniref:Uncharacterized protein n=1 Tax=Dermacentor silvarum TaxID=543639 RepID=A0ACB8D3L7_DERSI|nr:hypothetical protein HPB49_005998 [Dermacentor silvarum]